MLPRPLLLSGCFLLAMFAGWAVRGVKASAGNTQAAATLSSIPPVPEDMDGVAIRIWLAEHLPDADGARLAEIAARLPSDPDSDERAWQALFSCWFEKDPQAAWAFASGHAILRRVALEKWAALDLAAARAALESPPVEDLATLVRGALEKDVSAAFRLIEEAIAADPREYDEHDSRNPFNPTHLFGLKDGHFAKLASIDPDAVTAWAKRLGMNDMDGPVFWGRWMKDPAAAREWLGQQERPDRILSDLAYFAQYEEPYRPALTDFLADAYPVGNDRMEAIQAILEGLAYRDPDFAAKEAARMIPDQGLRAEAIGKIASILARTDFAKAWSLLETIAPSASGIRRVALPKIDLHAGSADDQLGHPFHYGWSLTSMRGLESPAGVKASLLEKLIETDKDEAIRLMERLPAKDLPGVGADAINRWMDRDHEEAIRWLAGKLGKQGNADEIEDLVDDFPETADSLQLLRSLPEGSVRDTLTGLLADQVAEADPLAALSLARETSTSDVPVIRAYDEWASSDPLAAMDHLAGDADAPAQAWKEVADEAFKKDPAALAEAIGNLSNSTARDIAIRSMMKSMVNDDPLQAGAWALALHDTGQRKSAMESVLSRVSLDLRLMQDPATVEELRQHLNDAGDLPETERQQWSDRIDREFAGP